MLRRSSWIPVEPARFEERDGFSNASGLSHYLDNLLFAQWKLAAISLIAAEFSGFAVTKLPVIDAVFMPSGTCRTSLGGMPIFCRSFLVPPYK